MEPKIKHCTHQASLSRQKALFSGDSDQKTSWLLMAEMWDELAREYKSVAADYDGLERLGSSKKGKQAVASPMTRAVDRGQPPA